jgi:hypothetical protein
MGRVDSCHYCGASGVQLAHLPHWDNPDKGDWYCRDHWYSVRGFQNQQKERFLNYYSNPVMRERLSESQLRLWETLRSNM